MNRDVIHWCCGCLMCTTRNVGRKVRPPMTPVPVTGPFDKVGGDVLQLKSCNGNMYLIVTINCAYLI